MGDKLIAAARHRGRIFFIAGRDKVTYTFNHGQAKEITIRQNSGFDNSDLENLCRLAARKLVQIGPLLREVVPLTEVKRIYDILRDTPNQLGAPYLHGKRLSTPFKMLQHVRSIVQAEVIHES